MRAVLRLAVLNATNRGDEVGNALTNPQIGFASTGFASFARSSPTASQEMFRSVSSVRLSVRKPSD